MALQPKTTSATSVDDLITYIKDGLYENFYNDLTINQDTDLIIPFIGTFVLGATVVIKTGTIPLKGIVIGLSDFGALGVGGLIKLNALTLVGWIKAQ